MTDITLYALADDFRAAAAQLADMDLDAQTVADTLESLSGDLEVKASNTLQFARNLEATAVSIAIARKAMAERESALLARADRIRSYVLACMQSAGIVTIDTPYFRVSVRQNPESVEVLDEAQIPEMYMVQPPPPAMRADKARIKAALKAGDEVPGCRLARGVRLEVK